MAKQRAARKKTVFPGKAWAGRFTQASDPRAEAYASSLDVDQRLLPYDVVGSQAHAAMLARCRMVTPSEERKIQAGLKRILAEWRTGRLAAKPQDEDVHMLVERRLHELIGPVAGKLPTARSRNDQVVTDLKLYLQSACEELQEGLCEVRRVLFRLAERHLDWIMPGYTHLQVAQPVLVSHWLLAHQEAFARDAERFAALRCGSLDELPLGAAALAGTSHPIDRKLVAQYLGFSRITANSMDTVADRDFALEFLSHAAICAVHFPGWRKSWSGSRAANSALSFSRRDSPPAPRSCRRNGIRISPNCCAAARGASAATWWPC
jgi:argininosuccinate lyase